jgi:hypothetical protein
MADLTDTTYEGAGIHGYLAQFLVGDDASPENFEAVADVISITPPSTDTAVIDITHLRSPGAHREVIPGLRSSNPFTIRCNYRPSHESHSYAGGGSGSFIAGGLPYLAQQRTIKNFKVVIYEAGSPLGEELPVRGFISNLTFGEIGPDNKIEMSFACQPSTDFTSTLP